MPKLAKIPLGDDLGRTLDIHALRTTFGTLLSKAGLSLPTAQPAMRRRIAWAGPRGSSPSS
jgi:hypothetical protein